MKNLYLGILLLMSVSARGQDEIQGLWHAETENTQIEIMQTGGEWVGKIKSSDHPKAPIGKVILQNLKQQNEQWIGQLFVVKKQEWYDVVITALPTKLDLKVSAGFLTKNVQWIKVNP